MTPTLGQLLGLAPDAVVALPGPAPLPAVMPATPKVTITIDGPVGAGSVAALRIARFLQGFGWPVHYQSDKGEATSRNIRYLIEHGGPIERSDPVRFEILDRS